MDKTIVGLFDQFRDAQQAVRELVDIGFSRDDISLIANDVAGEYSNSLASADQISGTAAGAGTGAVIGGIGGLLVGLGALAIPGIGPVIAAGPLATTLLGAGVGAAAGGMIGALIDAGVPEEEAGYYAEGVRRGGTLVSVRAEDEMMIDRAVNVFERHGAVDVKQRVAGWRQSGWTRYDPQAGPYTQTQSPSNPDAMGGTTAKDDMRTRSATSSSLGGTRGTSPTSYETYVTDFRNNFTTIYRNRGYTYDRYEPAYRYGYTLAHDQRYIGKDWAAIEADARRDWEKSNKGAWEDFKDSIRYAWDRVRGRTTTRAA